jgi:hypothetical protein
MILTNGVRAICRTKVNNSLPTLLSGFRVRRIVVNLCKQSAALDGPAEEPADFLH